MHLWMLTAMRSGSTYLANMLHATGKFHRPERFTESPHLDTSDATFEFLAPNPHLDPWRQGKCEYARENCLGHLGYRAGLVKKSPCLFKILMEQYAYYKLTPGDRGLVEEIFPDLRYVWLERGDIYARTISAYQFFVSKMPHVYNERMKREYDGKTIPWDEKGVLDVYYNHVRKCDWSPFLRGTDFLKLDYDDLVRDPAGSLKKCLDFLGVSAGVDCKAVADRQPKFRTERPETKDHIRRLKKLITGVD